MLTEQWHRKIAINIKIFTLNIFIPYNTNNIDDKPFYHLRTTYFVCKVFSLIVISVHLRFYYKIFFISLVAYTINIYFSQFCGLEVQDQQVSKFGPWGTKKEWTLKPYFLLPCSKMVTSHWVLTLGEGVRALAVMSLSGQ